MENGRIKNQGTSEELEAKRQKIREELTELEELYEQIRREERRDFKLRIFHPVKWHRKHKKDPEWLRFEKENMGIKFVH